MSRFYIDDAMIDSSVTVAGRVYRGRWSQLVVELRDEADRILTTTKACDRLFEFAQKIDRGFWLGWKAGVHYDLKPTRYPAVVKKSGLPRLWLTRAARAQAIELGAVRVEIGSNLWQALFTQRRY